MDRCFDSSEIRFQELMDLRSQYQSKFRSRFLLTVAVMAAALVVGFFAKSALVNLLAVVICIVCIFRLFFQWVKTKSATQAVSKRVRILLSEQSLTACFGSFRTEAVTYPVLQYHCEKSNKVLSNIRYRWQSPGELMIHWANLTHDNPALDSDHFFRGCTISIPAGPEWQYVSRDQAAEGIHRAWKKPFSQLSGKKVLFSMDQIEGRYWLTVGFDGMHLDSEFPCDDYSVWKKLCMQEVSLLQEAVKMLRTVTPESCFR